MNFKTLRNILEAARQKELSMSTPRSKTYYYVVGVLLVLGSEFLLRDVFLPKQANGFTVGIVLILEWVILVVLMVVWLPKVERLPFASIGWNKIKWRHVWAGLLAYLLVTIALTISSFILPTIDLEPIRAIQSTLKGFSIPVLLGLFFTGALLEEIFYRGYLIERLTAILKHRRLAGVVSWLAFTLVHLKFFGVGPTIDISILSAALVLLYLKEKSIWPCIVLHGVNNALAYLIFPLLMP
jgi:membrane protease YdiL (CAAX protease family)